MIKERIKEELLKTKTLNEFNKICIENKIDFFKDLDRDLQKYYETLGNGGSAYNHEDPRKFFK